MQPHTLQISANDKIHFELVNVIYYSTLLALPSIIRELGITAPVDKCSHHEMIFQKVILPSSQYLTFLFSNRYNLKGHLLNSFKYELDALIYIIPFHRRTQEYVLASPIVMVFTSNLSTSTLNVNFHVSLSDWKEEGPEAAQSGTRILQALISEGFEDTLEQRLMSDKNGLFVDKFIKDSVLTLQSLGVNPIKP
ncbi:hypothetical protein BLNAU_23239 [Blattamonas nauphoetae]|uniref:Uncharacterized protein n=1 Tax=Blattamonas nauphoetae TaxID=2049346 RepID=A0ABQ9WR89_9EUKA|nr:hypothetical protein BLNAU_23239 [Blattamonas nauphoetae]